MSSPNAIADLELDRPARAMLHSQIDQMGVAALGNFILAAVMIFAYYDRVPASGVAIFGFSAYSLNIFRLAFRHVYRAYQKRFVSTASWRSFAVSISCLNGIVWGAWGWYVASHVQAAQTVTMYVVLAGITAGAVATSSASRLGFALFVLPALGPLIVFEFLQFTRDSVSLALAFSLYLTLMMSSSKKIHNTMRENVLSVQAKQEMVTHLEQQQLENLRLNEELEEKILQEKEHVHELEQLNRRSQQLANELLKKSSTDSLTGISNRRSLDERLDRQWRMAIRNQLPIALIMFDIDWFKRYNDSMGHVAGDECLCEIAKLSVSFFLREEDLVSRYGGEEFAVLLPGMSIIEAETLAEKFCRFIYDKNVPHGAADVYGRVTISGGVASIVPSLEQSPSVLIEQADYALYKSKNAGRNTVTAYRGGR